MTLSFLFDTARACALLLPLASSPARPDFADPFVLRDEHGYVAFATGAGGTHLQAARSTDMRAWTQVGDALPSLPRWADTHDGFTWAPSVTRRDGGYVLYYTARHAASGFECIGRAVSSHAEGPYVDDSKEPFVCQTSLCGSIDPSPFVDRDGSVSLLWKSDENSSACHAPPRIWAQRLSRDGMSLVGEPMALLARDRAWEGDIIEAPSMIRHGDELVLFYSANWYASTRYAVGVATCSSVFGPCTKSEAPLVTSHDDELGPGGAEAFSDGQHAWVAYHAWSAPVTTYESGGARSLRIASLDFDDGKPRFGAPLDVSVSSLRLPF